MFNPLLVTQTSSGTNLGEGQGGWAPLEFFFSGILHSTANIIPLTTLCEFSESTPRHESACRLFILALSAQAA